MRRTTKRLTTAAALALSGGMLFQTGGVQGCTTFAAQGAVSAVNFCLLFDCNGGLLVRPCGDPATNVDDILQDCPQVAEGG